MCEVSSACVLAQSGRDHRLALLLAQATTGLATRQMLTAQLTKWNELDVSSKSFVSAAPRFFHKLI